MVRTAAIWSQRLKTSLIRSCKEERVKGKMTMTWKVNSTLKALMLNSYKTWCIEEMKVLLVHFPTRLMIALWNHLYLMTSKKKGTMRGAVLVLLLVIIVLINKPILLSLGIQHLARKIHCPWSHKGTCLSETVMGTHLRKRRTLQWWVSSATHLLTRAWMDSDSKRNWINLPKVEADSSLWIRDPIHLLWIT